MKTQNTNQVLRLAGLAMRLRALILALGESVSPAWWNTEFMNETGLRFLERLYPRTALQAAVHAAGKAACDVHDRAVGRVGVYHLFRLPESLESEINRIPPDFDEEFVSRFRAGLGHPDKLMELLASLCDGAEGADATLGAKRIGVDKDLMTTEGFEKTAMVYQQAFVHGKPAFPYFAAEPTGGQG